MRAPGGGHSAMAWCCRSPSRPAFRRAGAPARRCTCSRGSLPQADVSVDESIASGLAQAQADQRAQRLSGGQRRRLDVAMALIGDPELLFLDEPTTGFDPAARREAWEVIESLRGLGKTILLTTHYLEEAQRLADRVAIVKDGRIVADDTPEGLAGAHTGQALIAFRLPDGVEAPPAGLSETPTPGPRGTMELRSAMPVADLALLCGWAQERGIDLPGLEVRRPTLEDIYLELTA